MRNVMLIDDDLPMLHYIRQLIPWEQLGLTVCGAINASIKALQQFELLQPELVILDIDMPQMDGMELCARIHAIKPQTRVIFLTCHADFHFAKRAVELQADDYLTKHDLTAETLEASVRKSLSRMDALEAANREPLVRHQDTLRRNFFNELQSTVNPSYLLPYAARLGIHWPHPHFLLHVAFPDLASFPPQYRFEDYEAIYYGLYNIAVETAQTMSFNATTFVLEDGTLVQVLNIAGLQGTVAPQLDAFEAQLQRHAAGYLKIGLTFARSGLLKGLDAVPQELRHLRAVTAERFYGAAAPSAREEASGLAANATLPADVWDALGRAFAGRTHDGVADALERLQREALARRTTPALLLAACSQWVQGVEIQHKELNHRPFHTLLQQARTLREAVAVLYKHLLRLGASRLPATTQELKLQAVDRYIAEHISEDITLVDMASHLYLNPSYFSRDFKKRTGTNFSDYVHQFKMQEAARMLRSGEENVSFTAYHLGYSDRTYFSKLFKKYMGVSPKDYK
ncbi:response regulator [Paenibacillus roseipurpureus]|uniref:Response regulator n=1 Tax=Paenibacillus roseopurpureus TaxID=2918901 RepID=A0AA96RLB7_9BACL|nr:response regulator [Paenibacillus sp. MBLB1832]WNR42997.1 response regulator [Paenibacillus sp. MBLB1832]